MTADEALRQAAELQSLAAEMMGVARVWLEWRATGDEMPLDLGGYEGLERSARLLRLAHATSAVAHRGGAVSLDLVLELQGLVWDRVVAAVHARAGRLPPEIAGVRAGRAALLGLAEDLERLKGPRRGEGSRDARV